MHLHPLSEKQWPLALFEHLNFPLLNESGHGRSLRFCRKTADLKVFFCPGDPIKRIFLKDRAVFSRKSCIFPAKRKKYQKNACILEQTVIKLPMLIHQQEVFTGR